MLMLDVIWRWQANSVRSSLVRFMHGDWTDVCALLQREAATFDLMLTSETIYNTDYYGKLCALISRCLKPDGLCLLATKRFYFGVGGGVRVFEAACESFGLVCVVLEVLEDKASNIRELCAIRHAPCK
jgi:hypothetical protein